MSTVLGWMNLMDNWQPDPPGSPPYPVWIQEDLVRCFWIADNGNPESPTVDLYCQDISIEGRAVTRLLNSSLDRGRVVQESIDELVGNPVIMGATLAPDGTVLLDIQTGGGGGT